MTDSPMQRIARRFSSQTGGYATKVARRLLPDRSRSSQGPESEPPPESLPLSAGIACTDLIAKPWTWINRRVETMELLSHEETRRRVSVDFTLSNDRLCELEIDDGIGVPISVLTKAPRRDFDLRDESGRAVPVLGRQQNGALAHVALLNAALEALPEGVAVDVFDSISADLRQVVDGTPTAASDALAHFIGAARAGDEPRRLVVDDETCGLLLDALWQNYVLVAVLPSGGPNRRVLKYSYADDFNFDVEQPKSISPRALASRAWLPDRERFLIECPGAWRSASFHAEVSIPEELRIDVAMLYDLSTDEPLSLPDRNVNRASLYADGEIEVSGDVHAYVQIAPERSGQTVEAAVTSAVVAALLWLGVASGLKAEDPGAAASILLAGAALFSGFTAVRGEHRLVRRVFSASRRWLTVVSLTALAASATLALEVPDAEPVSIWRIAAILCTIAAIRLVWSAVRARE